MPSLRMALALHASIPRARPSSQPCPRTPSRQGGSSSGGSPQTKPSRRPREAVTARPAPPTPKPLRPPRTTRAFCQTRQQTFDGTTENRTYPRSVHEGHTAPPIARPTKDVDDERREDDLASLHHKRQQTKPCSPDSPHTLTTTTHTASKGTRRRTLASDLRGPAQNRPPKSTPSCRRLPPESVASKTKKPTIRPLCRFTVRAHLTQRSVIPKPRPETLHNVPRGQSWSGARRNPVSRPSLQRHNRAAHSTATRNRTAFSS